METFESEGSSSGEQEVITCSSFTFSLLDVTRSADGRTTIRMIRVDTEPVVFSDVQQLPVETTRRLRPPRFCMQSSQLLTVSAAKVRRACHAAWTCGIVRADRRRKDGVLIIGLKRHRLAPAERDELIYTLKFILAVFLSERRGSGASQCPPPLLSLSATSTTINWCCRLNWVYSNPVCVCVCV